MQAHLLFFKTTVPAKKVKEPTNSTPKKLNFKKNSFLKNKKNSTRNRHISNSTEIVKLKTENGFNNTKDKYASL